MYIHCIVQSFSKAPNSESTWFCQEKICANKHAAVSQKLYKGLDHDHHSEIIAFYTEFSKTFVMVLHYELIQILIDIGVDGDLLAILIGYLINNLYIY